MKDQYKSDEKSTYVKDLDANNLFEWAMIQKLPTNGFAWEKVKDFTPPPPSPHQKIIIIIDLFKKIRNSII